MNSRWLWNLLQRHKFLRAEASRDILKIRVLEMAFPGVFRRYFPPWTPCCFVRIHARLGTNPSKCSRHSMTSHGSNVSQYKPVWVYDCSMSFKTGTWVRHNFIWWCFFLLAEFIVEREESCWRFWPATGPFWQP